MKHLKLFENFFLSEDIGKKPHWKTNPFKKGDLAFVKGVGQKGLVGLVVADQKNDKYGVPMCKVYFRGLNGETMEVAAEELIDIIPDYFDLAMNKDDVGSYKRISKKLGIELNPRYEDYEETANEEW